MVTDAVTPPNPAGAGGSKSHPDSKPDPTLLTIDAVRREIAQTNATIEDGLDSAEKLNQERFRRVDDALARAEQQRIEQKADTQKSVDAALASQKEAAVKSEAAATSRTDGLAAQFGTEIRSLTNSIADLKDRLTKVEAIKQGMIEQRTERREGNAGMIAVIGLGIAILLAALTIVGFLAGSG